MTVTPQERRAVLRLREDPTLFADEVLGVKLLPFQSAAANSIRDHRRTAVVTAPGVGKTLTAAAVVLWWWTMFPGSRVITTAPTAHHVEAILWAEIAKRYHAAKVPLNGQLTRTKLEKDRDWVAYGLSTNEPSAFGGAHTEKQLVLFDDAHGVPGEIWAITNDNLMAGDSVHWAAIGNPLPWSVREFRECFRPGSGWNCLTMSRLSHPNVIERRSVIPGACSFQQVEDIRAKFGENSREWKTDVLGEWAEGSEDVLVPVSWLEAADANPIRQIECPHMGVDVARYGSDRSVATITKDRKVIAVKSWQGADTMESVGIVRGLATEYGVAWENVHVDVIGVGTAIVDRMREQGLAVDAVNFAEAPKGDWAEVLGPMTFKNRRAELHWAARELVRRRELHIPREHVETWRDLSVPTFKDDSAGRRQIQSKDEIKALIGCSPDYGDSLVLALSRGVQAGVIWI